MPCGPYWGQDDRADDGHRLVKKSSVSEALLQAMAKRSERTEITQDMVVAELAKIGFANMLDYMAVMLDRLLEKALSRAGDLRRARSAKARADVNSPKQTS